MILTENFVNIFLLLIKRVDISLLTKRADILLLNKYDRFLIIYVLFFSLLRDASLTFSL